MRPEWPSNLLSHIVNFEHWICVISRLFSFSVAFPVMETLVFRCHPREIMMKMEMTGVPQWREAVTAGQELRGWKETLLGSSTKPLGPGHVPTADDFGVQRRMSSWEPRDNTAEPQLDCWWLGEVMSFGGKGSGSLDWIRDLKRGLFYGCTWEIGIVPSMPTVFSLTWCFQALLLSWIMSKSWKSASFLSCSASTCPLRRLGYEAALKNLVSQG